MDWFLDHAQAVKAQRVANGLPTDPHHYGEWIADVERPAEHSGAATSCASTRREGCFAARFPTETGSTRSSTRDRAPARRTARKEAVAEARKDLGTPYLCGDLVFFRDASGYVHHVGMSLGGNRVIEAPRTGLKVRISSLDDPYYSQQFTGARRFDRAVNHEARVMQALRPDQINGRR